MKVKHWPEAGWSALTPDGSIGVSHLSCTLIMLKGEDFGVFVAWRKHYLEKFWMQGAQNSLTFVYILFLEAYLENVWQFWLSYKDTEDHNLTTKPHESCTIIESTAVWRTTHVTQPLCPEKKGRLEGIWYRPKRVWTNIVTLITLFFELQGNTVTRHSPETTSCWPMQCRLGQDLYWFIPFYLLFFFESSHPPTEQSSCKSSRCEKWTKPLEIAFTHVPLRHCWAFVYVFVFVLQVTGAWRIDTIAITDGLVVSHKFSLVRAPPFSRVASASCRLTPKIMLPMCNSSARPHLEYTMQCCSRVKGQWVL